MKGIIYIYLLVHTLHVSAYSFTSATQTIAARQETTFLILTPELGDTVGLTQERSGADVNISISWTVPPTIAGRDVYIALVQGNNQSNLSELYTVEASAPNNGSYRWDAFYTNPLVVYDNHYNLASGCNYSITLKSWTDQIYSPFFAIINPTDGGLPTNASCPQDHGKFSPSNGTWSENPKEPSGTGTTIVSIAEPLQAVFTIFHLSRNSHRTLIADNVPDIPSPQPSSGISTTTLVIGVVVPIVVLLLAFVLLVWLAYRKGWINRKGYDSNHYQDHGKKISRQTNNTHSLDRIYDSTETDHGSRPHQAGSREVYQLHGNDVQRP